MVCSGKSWKGVKGLGVQRLWFSLLWVTFWAWPWSALGGTLSDIQHRGYLVVAVKDNLEPLAYRTPSGTIKGFEVDLAQRLAQSILGSSQALRLQPVLNTERLQAVTSGRVDVAIAQITLTENRMRQVNFSEPYYRSGTGILTQSSQWSSLSKLSRQAIAILQPSVSLPYLRNQLPQSRLMGVSSYRSAQDLLAQGKVKAIVGDQIILSNLAKNHPSYQFYPTPLTYQPLAIALPKGVEYESLRLVINQNIRQWHQQGWLETQRQKWGLP